jgi:tetratricopeptide (TPR) repeat protein
MTLRGKASFGAVLGIGWLAGFAPSAAHAQATPPMVDAARAEGTTEAVAAPLDGEGADPAGGHAAPREAVELFQRAREEYRTGRYQDAARDLEVALVIDPSSPTLLFNLARVYELQGDLERAIAVYRHYVRVVPASDAAERARAEAAVLRLEGAQEYTRPDEDAYSQPIYVSQRGVADDAFWATLGTGAGVTLAGAAMVLVTVLVRQDADLFTLGRDGSLADRDARYQGAADLALATDITGAVGGATLIASALLWGLRERSVEMFPQGAAPSIALGVSASDAVVRVGGSF